MENEKVEHKPESQHANRNTSEQKPKAPEAKIPNPNEKMDIPVPHRPGSEIIIGPEGPYSNGY